MRVVTELDPRATHHADRVAISARALGEPLIPWQYEAAKLITAVDPDDPKRMRYGTVVITVPRQAGKSTLLRAVHLDRIIRPIPGQHPTQPVTLWMTAQRGKDARRRFSDLTNRVTNSPALSTLFRLRRSVGSEALTLGNVSLSPFAPTADALHGETTPFVSVDEAWAFDETRAAALLAAIVPPMQNYEGSQLVIVSTAGDYESRWLWSLTKAGREAVTDSSSRLGYVEYSADTRDIDSPTFLDFHPAAGHVTTTEAIRDLFDAAGSESNILRGFGNLWPEDMDASVITRDLTAYDTATQADKPATTGQTVFAFDIAADRSGAAIYAATPTANGALLELVESGPGIAWLTDTLTRLQVPIWYDPTGYTGAVAHRLNTPQLEAATFSALAASASQLLLDIAENRIALRAAPELRDQYAHAITRPTAGTGFIFDADKSPGSIDHIRAAALALWAATQTTAAPVIEWA